MDDLKRAELMQRAAHRVGDVVHWRGTVYRITGRYWRQWNDSIVYDLLESVRPGSGTPRSQRKVLEKECEKPSLRSLGLGVDPGVL